MYESFYRLTEKPFSIQPDPDFLFFGRRHSMAYSMLEYGVENRAGFTVITGEVGAGKTTLIRHLLNNLPGSVTVGLITNTHQHTTNLLEWVMLAFGQPYDGMSPVALFDAFQNYLIKEYSSGRRAILIIDEAQNLSPDALEALRVLSNINADKHQLLQLILTGQPQLKYLLGKPELEQFAQRVAVDFHLSPITGDEVTQYIQHRLEVAGRSEPLFTDQACQAIAKYSKGIPRTINILCDTALVYGMSLDAEMVDEAIVEEVMRDKRQYGVFSYDEGVDPAADNDAHPVDGAIPIRPL
jgi:type II secretory pathway predicted ATPase ExeA